MSCILWVSKILILHRFILLSVQHNCQTKVCPFKISLLLHYNPFQRYISRNNTNISVMTTSKILLSHRRSWTAYRDFLRRIRSLCWRFRRGWGKIESIKCLNASHKALLLCGAYKKELRFLIHQSMTLLFLGNTKTPHAALSSNNKKSHDGQCPSRRVTGRGDGTLNNGFKPAFRLK